MMNSLRTQVKLCCCQTSLEPSPPIQRLLMQLKTSPSNLETWIQHASKSGGIRSMLLTKKKKKNLLISIEFPSLLSRRGLWKSGPLNPTHSLSCRQTQQLSSLTSPAWPETALVRPPLNILYSTNYREMTRFSKLCRLCVCVWRLATWPQCLTMTFLVKNPDTLVSSLFEITFYITRLYNLKTIRWCFTKACSPHANYTTHLTSLMYSLCSFFQRLVSVRLVMGQNLF